jgi:hypothetical protein
VFTWEEAGLLRQMILVVVWGLVAVFLAGLLWFVAGR